MEAPLHRTRLAYKPPLPKSIRSVTRPLRIGVVLSGGPAPGGHNVIAGIFDALPKGSELIGFVGGPSGIIDNEAISLDAERIDRYRNLGGFDMIGSGRTKIESEEQMAKSLKTVQAQRLDGLVVIGGDDSNTNAAFLAHYFGDQIAVVGVPKTIDGDLKNDQIEISFGHDTACRVYSEMIGNLMRDAASARKYYHVVRVMGRSASHIALECALQTHPNLCVISEEVADKKMSFEEIREQIAEMIEARGKKYGVIIVPEGLIEFIPDKIPDKFLRQLDPHGNLQVSAIETEKLLLDDAIYHFFGYEGRSAMPTNFDCSYCAALGWTAARLVEEGRTGVMACVGNLRAPVEEWTSGGFSLESMMGLEVRKGVEKRVIRKALVDLQGASFKEFAANRKRWALEDEYRYPGPIQFGDTFELPFSLTL